MRYRVFLHDGGTYLGDVETDEQVRRGDVVVGDHVYKILSCGKAFNTGTWMITVLRHEPETVNVFHMEAKK